LEQKDRRRSHDSAVSWN